MFLLITLVAGCGASERQAGEPSELASETVTHVSPTSDRSGSAGVTVTLPSGWHTTTWSDGNVIDPLTRVVVASAPIRPQDSACQVAQYDFGADAVAVVVLEWREPLRTLPERPARFTGRELVVSPPPAIECFDGSGGSTHFIDEGRAFGAYLLVGPQAPTGLIEEARGILGTLEVARRGDAPRRRLGRNGISVAVPEGWDGRIFFREASGRDGVIFQVANFELPDNEGLEPPRELPPGEEDPIKAMDDGAVLMMISDGGGAGAAAPQPVTLADLASVDSRRALRGHSLAKGSFCFLRRCVEIEVDFGSTRPRDKLVRDVNSVLASLTVGD